MTSKSTIAVPDRFVIVRQQLDELGYHEALVIDALPLAEHLLGDLIQTTESLRRYKDLATQALEKCNIAEQSSQPYLEENARLVRECNDIHKKLMLTNESLQNKDKNFNLQLKAQEKEVSDLKLFISQLQVRLQELQTESAEKTKKLLEKEKFDYLITVPAGGPRKSFSVRKAKMQMDAPLPSSKSASNKGNKREQLSVIKVIEQQAANLATELSNVQCRMKDLTDRCSSLEGQVKSRDQEIERLQKMLGSGMPACAVIKERDLEKMSSLEEDKKTLKKHLEEATSKQHEAMKNAVKLAKKNEKLAKEMKDMDKLACAIDIEKTALKKKVTKAQEDLNACEIRNQALREELRVLQEQCAGVGPAEKWLLEKKLESANSKLREMKNRERELMLEIQRLTSKPSASRASHSRKTHVSRSRADRPRDDLETLPKQLDDGLPSHSSIQQATEKLEQQLQETSKTIERLGREKDHYSSECRRLESEVNRLSRSAPLGSDRLQRQLQETTKIIENLQREKDQYSSECKRLESEVTRLASATTTQADVADLRQQLSDRGKELTAAQQAYTNLGRELTALKAQARPSSADASLAANVPQIERERDLAKADAQRLQQEVERLRGQLQTPREDRGRLQELETEHHELLMQQSTQRSTISSLEQQLRATEADLTRQRTQYLQLKNLHEQTEASLKGLKAEMGNMRRDLAEAQARLGELSGLQAELNTVREERARLRAASDSKDAERDSLLLQVDERSERIATLQSELKAKESLLSKTEKEATELKRQLEQSQDASLASQQDARGMGREVERLRSELEKLTAHRDATQRENKRLQGDLAAALTDCNISNRDLALCQREVEDLKQKLQDYVAEVERVEQLLAQKESDRTDLLEHFRSLSQEATELSTHNHTLKSETSEARRTLHETESQLRGMEEQLASSKALAFSYEAQVVELTQHVNGLEVQLKQLRDHSQVVERDLDAVRHLCMNLDTQKESLQDELMHSRMKCAELEATCASVREELEAVQSQLNCEVGTKDALESVLENSREESLRQRLSNEELSQQVASLQHKVSLMERKLDESGRQTADSCQVDTLKRQLVNEQYERARASEERSATCSNCEEKQSDSGSLCLSLTSLSAESSQ